MDPHTFETLEVDALRGLLQRHVQTPLGRDRVVHLQPLTDPDAIDRSQSTTRECILYLESGRGFGLAGIEDPGPSLAQLQVEGTTLEPRQLLELERLVTAGMELRERFREAEDREAYPGLAAVASQIPDLRTLLDGIRGKILPGGELDDDASPELRKIRYELLTRRARIHRTLEGILRSQSAAVQEELVTFRNGRFVIPVRTDSRSHVPGVVHGLSSSGQTTFLEPMAVIDQNNDLVRLREQEEIEIARILREMTDAFRAHREDIRGISAAVARVDLSQAKAHLASEFGCVRPVVSAGRDLVLKDARHILLDHGLRRSGGGAVPISLYLDEDHQVLVISGPNAGGKTVVLKTVGLIALMAQMGLHVPAAEAVLPVYEQVYADIGDQQSIAANLSTFTAHMRNIAAMAKKVSPPALLLLDEVGTGTDPEEGAALATAIVEYFRRTGAATLATTHYNPLKMWASQAKGVLNASVEFDERSLRPTYRLIMGIAGASSGLEIARRMDVPAAILEEAQSLTSPDHNLAREYLGRLKTLVDEQSALRSALEEERAATSLKFAGLEDEFARREDGRRAEFEQALERATREFERQAAELLRGVKDRLAAERLRKTAQDRAARLRRAARDAGGKIEAELGWNPTGAAHGPDASRLTSRDGVDPEPGDGVWILPLRRPGTVESVRDNVYTVAVGALKFRAQREDLQLVESRAATADHPPPPKPAPELTLESRFAPELKVIGLTADEATQRVDKFLDEAFLSDAESVRIIHGHGKGILRRAIAELLTGHPHVARFNPAPPDQGGGGATIVELKK